MKPVIERELEAIRQMVRDLERRLKNEREQLGHREVFDYGRRGEVPAPTLAQRGYSLTTDGWALVSGSGGGGLATVEVDNLTIGGDGSSDSPLSASLLSGTIDARIKNLSGTIDGHFNALDFLSSVASDDSISGDGTVGNPLSAYSVTGTLSGTIDGAIKAILTSSQVWSQTADGSEGTTLQANLPHPFPDTSYYAFVTNYSGSQNPVFKTINKTAYGFQVVSTAPFANGDKVDLLAISGGLGPVADGTGLVSLSGTINSAIVSLSATLNSAIAAGGGGSSLSGTVIVTTDWCGGRASYSGTTPLVVGGLSFDPTTLVTAGCTASYFFRAVAACGLSSTTGSVRLWSYSDSTTICTASFAGTETVCIDIPLHIGGSATYHLPSSQNIYEVQIYATGSEVAGGTLELYSAQLRTVLRIL